MSNTNQPGGTKRTEALEEWEDIVANVFVGPGWRMPLAAIYGRVQSHPRAKVDLHWKAKIRQVLQRSPLFENVNKGVWKLKVPDPKTLGESEAR